jgi:hypothetical protein
MEEGVAPRDGISSQSNKVTIEEIEDEDMVRASPNNDRWVIVQTSSAQSFTYDWYSSGQFHLAWPFAGYTFPEDTFNFDASFNDHGIDFDSSDSDDFELIRSPPKPGPSSTETMPPPASAQPLAEQGTKKQPTDEPEFDSLWDSGSQLVAFRDASLAIADDFLKSEGIELDIDEGRRPFRYTEQGKKFFKLGKTDARKIDVRRKRIKYVDDD